MSQVHPESDTVPLVGQADNKFKICGYATCGLILLGILLAIIFVPNPNSSVCGSSTLPDEFSLVEKSLSITDFRHNVDVIVKEGNKTTVLGQFYRKLITRKRTYRFVDTHDHIGASMERDPRGDGATYEISSCSSNDTYVIHQQSFYRETDNTWDVQFKISRSTAGVEEATEVAVTPTQLASSATIELRRSSGNGLVASLSRKTEAGFPSWSVSVGKSDLPQFVVGFFGVAVTDTAHYIDVDMSSSPSPSPSITPSTSLSPSASPSRNFASESSPSIMVACLLLSLLAAIKL